MTTTPKKTVKKVAKKKVAKKKVVKQTANVILPKTGEYHVVMTFNDKIHEFDTDDLFNSIMERKPVFLKTRIIFKITNKEGKVFEKLLFVFGGKMLFRNKLSLNIFISRMRFK